MDREHTLAQCLRHKRCLEPDRCHGNPCIHSQYGRNTEPRLTSPNPSAATAEQPQQGVDDDRA
jgi:hypothetical protein